LITARVYSERIDVGCVMGQYGPEGGLDGN
jgi:hypothetical protein